LLCSNDIQARILADARGKGLQLSKTIRHTCSKPEPAVHFSGCQAATAKLTRLHNQGLCAEITCVLLTGCRQAKHTNANRPQGRLANEIAYSRFFL
jgi:hypothetical protein